MNRGNYVELLNYTAKLDENWHNIYIIHYFDFYGLSNKIQNDLIKAVGMIVEYIIKEEIVLPSFIAAEVNKTTDISCTAQCSSVMRYMFM